MKIVMLLSGGLDSFVSARILLEQGYNVYPLYVDYGHAANMAEREVISYYREIASVASAHRSNDPLIVKTEFPGNNRLCSLFNPEGEKAELAGRNFVFLSLAISYALELRAKAVAFGVSKTSNLHNPSIYADTGEEFVDIGYKLMGLYGLDLLLPVYELDKRQILRLAESFGIKNYHSCIVSDIPCGSCINCKELKNAILEIGLDNIQKA